MSDELPQTVHIPADRIFNRRHTCMLKNSEGKLPRCEPPCNLNAGLTSHATKSRAREVVARPVKSASFLQAKSLPVSDAVSTAAPVNSSIKMLVDSLKGTGNNTQPVPPVINTPVPRLNYQQLVTHSTGVFPNQSTIASGVTAVSLGQESRGTTPMGSHAPNPVRATISSQIVPKPGCSLCAMRAKEALALAAGNEEKNQSEGETNTLPEFFS
jgi:hypothetical protein